MREAGNCITPFIVTTCGWNGDPRLENTLNTWWLIVCRQKPQIGCGNMLKILGCGPLWGVWLEWSLQWLTRNSRLFFFPTSITSFQYRFQLHNDNAVLDEAIMLSHQAFQFHPTTPRSTAESADSCDRDVLR
jgi:hypothetical protein